MRADVKLGIVVSAGIVLIAGGYYLWRSPADAPIGIDDSPVAGVAQTKSKDESARASTPDRPTSTRQQSPRGSRTVVHRNTPRPNQNAGKDRQRVARQTTPRNGSENDAQPATRRPFRIGVTPSRDTTSSAASANRRTPATSPVSADRNAHNQQSASNSVSPAVSSQRAGSNSAGQGDPSGPITADSPAHQRKGTIATRRPVSNTPANRAPKEDGAAQARATRTTRALTATPPSSGGAAVDKHIVQPGDSFAALARKYYGSERFTDFLIRSNPHVSDPRALRVGVTLKIPPLPDELGNDTTNSAGSRRPASATRDSSAGHRTYRVREGDTFYGIAQTQLGDASRWTELLELNKSLVDGDPTNLRPGQEILLPKK